MLVVMHDIVGAACAANTPAIGFYLHNIMNSLRFEVAWKQGW